MKRSMKFAMKLANVCTLVTQKGSLLLLAPTDHLVQLLFPRLLRPVPQPRISALPGEGLVDVGAVLTDEADRSAIAPFRGKLVNAALPL